MHDASGPDGLAATTGGVRGISLRQMPAASMINLRGPADDPAFVRRCCDIIGLPLPIDPNRFNNVGARSCLWQGPDEWLVIDADAAETGLIQDLDDALADFHHAVTDVSGNRLVLRLTGGRALELLSAGCSLDVATLLSRRGMSAQTILARTPVTIQRIDEAPTFDLLVRRSFARYLQDWFAAVNELAGLQL